MFVLTPADDLYCGWFIYPIWCRFWCPEIEISSVDWAQPSRLLPEAETESSLRNEFLIKKNWTMDNVQKVHTYYCTELEVLHLAKKPGGTA
jgi:hypothetical protein